MHSHSIEGWAHHHSFLGGSHQRHERRTWIVVGVAATMMVVEIVGGTVFGSMALLADGWHMATHVSALGIAGLAYSYARRRADDPRFSFGTGKLGELAGFSSALILAMIALAIAYESALRVFHPIPIAYGEAIVIAVIGLGVNVISAALLSDGHIHSHEDADHHGHTDHNLRAAYLHVLADALTSVLAIGALFAAWRFGAVWIDPVVGIVGACVILAWSASLLRSSGAVLLDTVPDPNLLARIRERLETGGDRLSDLHLWRVGPGHAAVIASVVADQPQPVETYKARLADIVGLSHITRSRSANALVTSRSGKAKSRIGRGVASRTLAELAQMAIKSFDGLRKALLRRASAAFTQKTQLLQQRKRRREEIEPLIDAGGSTQQNRTHKSLRPSQVISLHGRLLPCLTQKLRAGRRTNSHNLDLRLLFGTRFREGKYDRRSSQCYPAQPRTLYWKVCA